MQRYFFLENEDNERRRAYTEKEDVISEEEEEETIKETPKKWVFRVRVSNLHPEEVVCVTGNMPELGEWVPEKCIQLNQERDPEIWSKEVRNIINRKFCILIW